jgi:hypothetical protein
MAYVILPHAVVVIPGIPGEEVVAYLSPRQFCVWVGRVGVEMYEGRTRVWEEEDECGTR